MSVRLSPTSNLLCSLLAKLSLPASIWSGNIVGVCPFKVLRAGMIVADKPLPSCQWQRLLRAVLQCHCSSESSRHPVFCACANRSHAYRPAHFRSFAMSTTWGTWIDILIIYFTLATLPGYSARNWWPHLVTILKQVSRVTSIAFDNMTSGTLSAQWTINLLEPVKYPSTRRRVAYYYAKFTSSMYRCPQTPMIANQQTHKIISNYRLLRTVSMKPSSSSVCPENN